MNALTVPTGHSDDAALRPVPWRRMAGVTWRQHRVTLGGVVMLLGGLALCLLLAGLPMHHAYASAAGCRPASSYGCQNQVINFTSSYSTAVDAAADLLHMVPALIGAFVGAPVLARELETGTFRYAWTQGIGRRRWTLAKLVPLAVTVTAAAGLFSLVISWYLRPFFADGSRIPLDPTLFGLRWITFAAWTLAAFAVGALAGLLIRRVVPAIAATLAVYAGLLSTARFFLQQHYLSPLVGRNLLDPPASAWILGGWWTKGGVTISQSAMNQITTPMFQQTLPGLLPKNVNHDDIKFYKGTANSQVLSSLVHHGYTHWISYQPGSRLWPFQWIEGGWLLALSAALIAATVWLVRRRAA
jgi:ABC-type transport system involved in multi-copper enzyme maturation permease subunit